MKKETLKSIASIMLVLTLLCLLLTILLAIDSLSDLNLLADKMTPMEFILTAGSLSVATFIFGGVGLYCLCNYRDKEMQERRVPGFQSETDQKENIFKSQSYLSKIGYNIDEHVKEFKTQRNINIPQNAQGRENANISLN